LVSQCLSFLSPLGISSIQAREAREYISKFAKEGDSGVEHQVDSIEEHLSKIQQQINRLTHGYVTEAIDEDSYRHITADLLFKKKSLTTQKRRVLANSASEWIQPTQEVIDALELAAQLTSTTDYERISSLLRKVGTNLLISDKTMKSELVPPYDFVANQLGDGTRSPDHGVQSSSISGRTSSLMCRLVDHLRTHFGHLATISDEDAGATEGGLDAWAYQDSN
jgi:hypothetical protein